MPMRAPSFRPNNYRTYSESREPLLYNKRWARASKAFKQQHPLCLGCAAVGRVAAAVVTDHIMPHKGDERLFWDQANWQPCCKVHHDVVKQRLELMLIDGRACNADLRLDSGLAQKLTRELCP